MAPDARVVVTGAGGQVGRALRALLPGAEYPTRGDLDVTDEAAVRRAVEGATVVVHAAAVTNVDVCETAPHLASAVNDAGTRHVAAAARAHGAKVVLLSTDYVFRGDAAPYAEDDDRDPVNVYGRTKAAAEDHLDPERDLVVRTSWVFGDGRNFLRTILAAARDGVPAVVDDQTGRPTSAAALAQALTYVVDAPRLTGRLHVAGDGPPCTWADLADAALERAGLPARVTRVDSATYAAGAARAVAPRPSDSTLDLARARRSGIPLVDWRTAVDDYVKGIV